MSVAYKISVLLYAIVVIVIVFAPNPVLSSELVGVVPFTNQRNTAADSWLGFYMQARLQAFLAEGCNCRFHSLNTIRLWQHQVDPVVPITIRNTVLITGSYQVVLEQGILELSLKRFSPRNRLEKFVISFAKDELELQLDQVFLNVAKWIEPGFKHKIPFNYPRHKEPEIRKVFEFRQLLYTPKSIPEISQIRNLQNQVSENSSQEFIADLAEGMILIASQLPTAEKKSMLNEAERILRSAAMKHVKNSRIHSLLAEVFFLSGKESSWVKQTAEKARSLDDNNSLALLLLILSDNSDNQGKEEIVGMIKDLNDINPWIWPEESGETTVPQFQKGIFSAELLSLHELIR